MEINVRVTSSQNKAVKKSTPPRNRTRLKPVEQMLGEDLTDSLRPGAINLTVMSERWWGGTRLGVMTTARDNTFCKI